MRKTDKKQQQFEEPVTSPFDVTGPSLLGDTLRRTQRATDAALKKREDNPMLGAMSIEKPDPNRQFMLQNRSQFGTRQHRILK
jgi:hypothetical protein